MLRRPQNRNLLLILILALLLRLIGLAARSIWYDEAFSILISQHGPAAIISGTISADENGSAAEEHPPAYYFIFWGWIQAFGNSVIAARVLSTLAGLGIVLLVYLIAKQSFDESTALSAAFFTAILPFQVHYAQEIRMYVFLALWITLAAFAFTTRRWILFAISAALAQYTHNVAAIYLVCLALIPLFQRDWKTLRALTLAGFASIIMYAPWLIQLPAQFAKVDTSYWIEKPGAEKLFTLILVYLPNLPLPPILLFPGLLIAALVISIAGYQMYRAAKEKSPDADQGLWFAYLAFVPPLLLWLISQIVPIFVERALLPSHVMFCIWLAWASTKTPMPRLIQRTVLALVLAASLMGIYEHINYRGFPYGPFAALDKSLGERMESGDIILHSNKLSYLPAFYFTPGLSQSFIAESAGSATGTLSPATMHILDLNPAEDMDSATATARRVWFIIYQNSIDEVTNASHETHPQLQYLDRNFTLDHIEKWDGLRLYLYLRSKQ